MEITIREISGKKALKKYVQFNIDLYKEKSVRRSSSYFRRSRNIKPGQKPGIRILRIGLLYGL